MISYMKALMVNVENVIILQSTFQELIISDMVKDGWLIQNLLENVDRGDNMVRVPRYGIHDGIKYSPRRTLIRFCIICGKPFSPTGKSDKVCGDKCRDKKNHKHNEKWNPFNNFKNNPINNANKVYKPPMNDKERELRRIAWNKWYDSLDVSAKHEYNRKKKMHKKKEYNHQDTLDELRSLGLR